MMAQSDLWSALEASWPAAHQERVGPFMWRDGAGGGSRVSAATLAGNANTTDLNAILDKFKDQNRTPLFQIRQGDAALDTMLDQGGFEIADPTLCLTAPVEHFATPDPETNYVSWPPIAVQRTIWHTGGIDAARLEVMNRVQVAKTSILARTGENPAGTAFVAALGPIAVVHALEVPNQFRRSGIATSLMSGAAVWAKDNGASTLAVLVTRANTGALALYSSLGMQEVDHYHYRRKGHP